MTTELSPDVIGRARRHAALGDPLRLTMVDFLRLSDVSPGEFGSRLGLPTNLVAHHLSVLAEAGLVERIRSEGDGRRTYIRLLPDAFVGFTGQAPVPASRVVFVCRHNSARSQLAAALWKPRSRVPVASAGTDPAPDVHPRAVRVAARHGLDLTASTTAHTDTVLRDGDVIVAVCDNAHEHLDVDAAARLHWSIPDPARLDTDAAFDAAFTEIASRIDNLAAVIITPGDSP